MSDLGEELDLEDAGDRIGAALATSRNAVMLLADGTVLQIRLDSATSWNPGIGSADIPTLEVRAHVTAAYGLPNNTNLPLPIHDKELP